MSVAPRPFWKLETMRPPIGVPVVVFWDGRGPFEVARVAHPRTRQESWLHNAGGSPLFLPQDRNASYLRVGRTESWDGFHTLKGAGPDAWSPLKPEAWTIPMPAPDFIYDAAAPPRFGHERQSFDAVAAASEMEADRAQARNEKAPAKPRRRKLWWLDPTEITYSPAGTIAAREAEGRIMRVLALESFVSFIEGAGFDRGGDDFWTIAALEAGRDGPDDDIPRAAVIEETQADRGDYDVAMSWFAAIAANPHSRVPRILYLASRPTGLTFTEMNERLALPRKRQALTVYRHAIDEVCSVANGQLHAGAAILRARMDSVRQANRNHRRGQM